MITGIDHIVILAPELAAATRHFEALGFETRYGGRHSTGTENALIGLADGSYLELLAFATPDPAHRWAPKLAFGGGFTDICLVSDDLEADFRAWAEAGIPLSPPREMSRQRPDGRNLVWRLSIPASPWAGQMPFLIEDISPNDWRLPAAGRHGNGATGIAALRWLLPDVEPLAQKLAAILRQEPQPLCSGEAGLAGGGFTLAGARLELLAPVKGAGSDAALAAEWLRLQGGGPWSLALYGPDGAEITLAPMAADRWTDWPA